jgi:hypothetical protein
MNYCREWQETLWLDVHGELTPDMRLKWEKHLEICKPCHQEREQLLQMLKNVTEVMPEPNMSHEDAAVFYHAVTEKMREKHHGIARWREWFFHGYIKPVHALTACCLLIVAFGWFGLRGPQQTTRVRTISDIGSQEQVIVKEIDLLENLELLEEMDTLEKLDQVLRS